jgi:hypothetical protein
MTSENTFRPRIKETSLSKKILSENEIGKLWTKEWLTGVADGSKTKSQRKLISVENQGRGLETVKAVARSLDVLLLLLEDDKGVELVAASKKPF